jgi:hypothetical protein
LNSWCKGGDWPIFWRISYHSPKPWAFFGRLFRAFALTKHSFSLTATIAMKINSHSIFGENGPYLIQLIPENLKLPLQPLQMKKKR